MGLTAWAKSPAVIGYLRSPRKAILPTLQVEPSLRRLRRRLRRHAAAAHDAGEPARDDIEHRREYEPERRHADHACEHCGAQRLPQLRAGADRPNERHHAEDEG